MAQRHEQGPLQDLPNGADLANFLDGWLKGGGKSEDLAPGQMPEQAFYQDPQEKALEVSSVEHFLRSQIPEKLTDLRVEAENMHKAFPEWKERTLNGLATRTDDEGRRLTGIVAGLTLGKVADHAKEKFNESSRKSGQELPGSTGEKHARSAADFWSRVQQITRAASELDKNSK